MRFAGSIIVISAILTTALFAFQNCSQAQFSKGTNAIQTGSAVPMVDPSNPGGSVVLPPFPPCKGSPSQQSFNVSGLTFNFSNLDASVILAQGSVVATTNPSGAVYAERFSLTDKSNNTIFDPGSSYSPTANTTPVATALGFIGPSNYTLAITTQNTATVTSSVISGQVYPLCGATKILWFRSKADLGSSSSDTAMSYSVTLDQTATVIIAAEKTMTNVPTRLALSVNIVNQTTNLSTSCSLSGNASWNYTSNSTPSVSGSCSVVLSAGRYSISNVISTDGNPATPGSSQHLGILAIAQ